MPRLGFPAISTPNAGTDKALRTWQQAVDNIRERFKAVETTLAALESTTTARAEAAATNSAATARELRDLLIRVNAAIAGAEALIALFSLEEPFEDGDIWVFRDSVDQFVPEQPEPSGGGDVLPLVTGEILSDQPVFVYLPDGSLVYGPVAEV